MKWTHKARRVSILTPLWLCGPWYGKGFHDMLTLEPGKSLTEGRRGQIVSASWHCWPLLWRLNRQTDSIKCIWEVNGKGISAYFLPSTINYSLKMSLFSVGTNALWTQLLKVWADSLTPWTPHTTSFLLKFCKELLWRRDIWTISSACMDFITWSSSERYGIQLQLEQHSAASLLSLLADLACLLLNTVSPGSLFCKPVRLMALNRFCKLANWG